MTITFYSSPQVKKDMMAMFTKHLIVNNTSYIQLYQYRIEQYTTPVSY